MHAVLLYVQYIICTVGGLPRSQDSTQWTPVHDTSHLNCSNHIPNASADVVCGLDMAMKRMRTASEMRDLQSG
jgi:hypothetical protein